MIVVKGIPIWVLVFLLLGRGYNFECASKCCKIHGNCPGSRQSPIALQYEKALKANIPELTFENYDVDLLPLVAKNNDHSVSTTVTMTIEDTKPSVSGGCLDSTYEVESFHFHWGSPQNIPGSEHTINDVRYDLELHVVHKNVKYKTIEDASNSPDGLVVLGLLFKNVDEKVSWSGLNEVYDALPYLRLNQSTEVINHSRLITMRSILANIKAKKFFAYLGSLTTPLYSEAVTWFVFTEIAPIEKRYLKRFWDLYRDNGVTPLVNNYRPIQATTECREVCLN